MLGEFKPSSLAKEFELIKHEAANVDIETAEINVKKWNLCKCEEYKEKIYFLTKKVSDIEAMMKALSQSNRTQR